MIYLKRVWQPLAHEYHDEVPELRPARVRGGGHVRGGRLLQQPAALVAQRTRRATAANVPRALRHAQGQARGRAQRVPAAQGDPSHAGH